MMTASRSLLDRIKYRAHVYGNAVIDLFRALNARNDTSLALFERLWPLWPKGFHGEFEYTELIKRFPKTAVFGNEKSIFSYYQGIEHAALCNPALAAKSFPKRFANRLVHFDAAYSIFTSTIYQALPTIRKARAKFGWTVYPGSFLIDNPQSDRRIRELIETPGFTGVIATQPLTVDYLISKFSIPRECIYYAFGGFFRMPTKNLRKQKILDNSRIRVVYCSHRHMPWARDKGLDVFVKAMELIQRETDIYQPVIVGPFSEELGEIRERLGQDLVWHEYLSNEELLAEFSENSDVFFAFLRPNLVEPGRFDGFPVAAAVQASACGLLVMINDPLKQGVGVFDSGSDYLESTEDPESCAASLLAIDKNRDQYREISQKMQNKVLEVYSESNQIKVREELLQKLLS
jgi:glycosyltransferase involved in cell wall biosynthesis